ncbi:23S rRNA (adenine(2503)-C(2))-methyltransferase RlmN [Deferribacter autotrophicus]|uniref:Probable dual-specificity RNA methyltransferase RlmN n=1 Tax=Deferribacter autotrophicus TaxID=500465 RepID=A0A5A8F8W6_9BACT|nr:23S rRNA (adenine(2503)-C(2))-methyltransferase RlmN [Deferribacter autotrophicus]KAA0259157.1 23S rRNA (adenine(2503)-C(2))-methyltransferase RlmN [Deferribacter autotrophicus]
MNFKIDCLSKEELQKLAKILGEKPYRGNQLFKWIYQKGVLDFSLMTDISKTFREKLNQSYSFTKLKIEHIATSKLDGSKKILFRLEDNNFIESVLMFDDDRITACISTQIGCRMGCKFCNTAKVGFIRNLTVGEIIRQIIELNNILTETGNKLTNIVFMGMGEPLDNLDNLEKSLEIILAEDGLNFSHRKVTISTAGLLDKLEKLTNKDFKVNIAISLNAPDNKKRNSIMPVNKKFDINDIVNTIKKLPIPKRKRITLEYVMIKNFNDSTKDALKLVKLFKGLPVKVNLIIYNKTKESDLDSPDLNSALNFQKTLINNGIATFIRKSFGADIEAACGQLYASYIDKTL